MGRTATVSQLGERQFGSTLIRWLAGGFLALLGPGVASAQVVQLPSFQFFTIDTSVLVPDRGSAYMGGISRSRSGRVERGVPGLSKVPGVGPLFGNRGIARSQSASGVSVSATIIDHAELDRAVLAAAGGSPSGIDPGLSRQASYLSRNVARHEPLDPPLRRGGGSETPSPADAAIAARKKADEIRLRNEQQRQQREADVERLIERGRAAEVAGKMGAARIYYKMAARKAKPELRQRILAYLENDFQQSDRVSERSESARR